MQISGGKYDRDDYMLQSAEVAGGEERGGEGWWFTITVMKMTRRCPGRAILMQDHEEGNHNIITNKHHHLTPPGHAGQWSPMK